MDFFEFVGLVLTPIVLLGNMIGAGIVASRLGRSSLEWSILALIFFPAAWIGLAVRGSTPEKVRARQLESGDWKECTACRELHRRRASACPHCGAAIEAPVAKGVRR